MSDIIPAARNWLNGASVFCHCPPFAAQMEAQSHRNAIGLVKVMGRQAGFIALISTLASCNVDACLIPEVPFYLDGDPGLLQYLRHRLARNGHAVVVLAEGAGQHLLLGDAEVIKTL